LPAVGVAAYDRQAMLKDRLGRLLARALAPAQEGQILVEYGVILGVIALGAVLVLTALGNDVTSELEKAIAVF
jgi:Flp pilus assembly pilin Flp